MRFFDRAEQCAAGALHRAGHEKAHRRGGEEAWLTAERDGTVSAQQTEADRWSDVLRHYRSLLHASLAGHRERTLSIIVRPDFRRRPQPEKPVRTIPGNAARASRRGIDRRGQLALRGHPPARGPQQKKHYRGKDRKSTRLNSSHQIISYAVFCL